jgi:hypothetical protein
MSIFVRAGMGLVLSLGLLVACGSQGESGNGGSGGAGGAGSGNNGAGAGTASHEFTCCINDTNYTCPSEAAFGKCAGFDIDQCMAGCDFGDFECEDACFDQWASADPDPSDCNEDPNASCNISSGQGGSPNTGSCNGTKTGPKCDLDSDCDTNNCFEGYCYQTSQGNPCDLDSDCDTNNCTGSCCRGNSAGNPCDLDSDCDSNNCADGECQ